ncbi:acyl carrier protein [Nonomuraea polychroma]|uniref:acyl carrier protein n=1 Tax=Nonomuraea polychroma TaxID=46176 RepID=UPI000FDD1050|nr:acyl carrier protein [Nonomuraea polychroma]
MNALDDLDVKPPVWLLTCGAQPVTPDDPPQDPAQATLWEHTTDRQHCLIDLPPEPDDAIAKRLARLLAAEDGLRAAAQPAPGAPQVALRSSGIFVRRLVPVTPQEEATAVAEPPPPPAVTRVEDVPEAERLRFLMELVRSQTAAVLGHAAPDAIDADLDFMSLGLSSLTAMELSTRLKEAGVELSPADLYDHSTPADLARHLHAQFGEPTPVEHPIP